MMRRRRGSWIVEQQRLHALIDDGTPAGRRSVNTLHSPDAYAFGIIMWEVLTLCEPWTGLALEEVFARVQSGKRPRVTAAVEQNAPPAYVELMRDMWQQDAAQRPTFKAALGRLRPLRKALAADEFKLYRV